MSPSFQKVEYNGHVVVNFGAPPRTFNQHTLLSECENFKGAKPMLFFIVQKFEL